MHPIQLRITRRTTRNSSPTHHRSCRHRRRHRRDRTTAPTLLNHTRKRLWHHTSVMYLLGILRTPRAICARRIGEGRLCGLVACIFILRTARGASYRSSGTSCSTSHNGAVDERRTSCVDGVDGLSVVPEWVRAVLLHAAVLGSHLNAVVRRSRVLHLARAVGHEECRRGTDVKAGRRGQALETAHARRRTSSPSRRSAGRSDVGEFLVIETLALLCLLALAQTEEDE